MAASSYDEALRRLLVHEGGYSDHPQDAGGPTMYGITIHDYRKYVNPHGTADDVRTMPLAVAKKIYREKYWNEMNCDNLPAGIDYAVFDYGVNSGVGRAPKVLQRIVGEAQDGVIGARTIAAAAKMNAADVINRMCDERIAFLRGLSNWGAFGKGWSRRVSEVRAAALVMAKAKPLGPKLDFASSIYAALKSNGIKVHEGKDLINIVYIEGCNTDGTPSQNRRNAFDDLRVVLQVDGKPRILGSWEATIETGVHFTENPINSDGAARIAFGQQRAWQVGYHRSAYEALVQTGGAVSVYRDANADYKRDGDDLQTGWFGINQHHGYNAPRDNIGSNSAGCLVGRSVGGHEEFMKLVKSDTRYRANHRYVFDTTVMPYSWLAAAAKTQPSEVPVSVPAAGFGAGIAAALAWLGANPTTSIAFAIVAAFGIGFALHWWRGKD